KQNEKAFSTEGNTDNSPGKQFQSLVNRDAYLQNEIQQSNNLIEQLNTQSQSFDSEIKRLAEEVQRLANNSGGSTSSIADLIAEVLGISEPRNKTVYDLITPLTQLLDADGKLPLNQLLATDNEGNITLIPRPKASFTRVAFARLQSSFTARTPQPNAWIVRDIKSVASTKPTGIIPNWIESDGVYLTFNSPGQYLLFGSGLSSMTDAHQARWKRYEMVGGILQGTNDTSEGLLIETTGFGINGETLVTDSLATHAFTIGVPGAPQPPVYYAIEHKFAKNFNRRASLDFGVPRTNYDSVFMVGSVIHIAIDTVDITDPRTIITDFNT
ncbi:MAG: hypothetical protein AAFR37_22425, partial [Cyanobacteria bacterium J06628_3]